MDHTFKKKTELKHGIYHVALAGTIDEFANFGTIPSGEISQIYVDFENVKYINSTGIKNWILWIKEIQTKKKDSEIFFSNCPGPIVDQMNVVKNFLPAGTVVKSFFVPFFCEICNLSNVYLYRLNSEYQKQSVAGPYVFKHPKVSCSSCRQPMTEDFLAEKYFSFLNKK